VSLRWPWRAAIERTLARCPEWGIGIERACEMHAYATAFVDEYAEWAENAEMQPAHLLKIELGPPDFGVRRGLAWRFTPMMRVQGFPRRGFVTAISYDERHHRASPTYVYTFHPKGGLSPVFGAERAQVLSTPPDRDLMP